MGVSKDFLRAASYYQRAAALECSLAQNNLGLLYLVTIIETHSNSLVPLIAPLLW